MESHESYIVLTNTKPYNRGQWIAAKGDAKGIDVAIFDDMRKTEWYMKKHEDYRPQCIIIQTDEELNDLKGKIKFHKKTMQYATIFSRNCDSLVKIPCKQFIKALEDIFKQDIGGIDEKI